MVVSGLYETNLLVVDQSKATRFLAAQEGIKEILVRVSGSDRILREPAIRPLINNPEAQLAQFSYESTNQSILNEQDQPVPAKNLKLSFDGRMIINSLTSWLASMGSQSP